MALANYHLHDSGGSNYDQLKDIEERLHKIDGKQPKQTVIKHLTLKDWSVFLSSQTNPLTKG